MHDFRVILPLTMSTTNCDACGLCLPLNIVLAYHQIKYIYIFFKFTEYVLFSVSLIDWCQSMHSSSLTYIFYLRSGLISLGLQEIIGALETLIRQELTARTNSMFCFRNLLGISNQVNNFCDIAILHFLKLCKLIS